ncbi:hypothetical protein ASG04_15005 [Curtobacterium sp. Leaf183]|uniref:hypothetical protein n=1 Tax=Curtobacterium sp. Leaf183 TaxID=1736291 RepID=UPI000701A602|nr:hypothetical protein [Curtobacterium sp. Leaf183]KQS07436.1 hypothetical protein ASG04_15005 [Curtobacterium sp. Leaf183]
MSVHLVVQLVQVGPLAGEEPIGADDADDGDTAASTADRRRGVTRWERIDAIRSAAAVLIFVLSTNALVRACCSRRAVGTVSPVRG